MPDGPGEREEAPPPKLEGLRDLIGRAVTGDRDALSRLFEAHEPMMVRWARRRLGAPLRTLDETRDVLHDAYQIVLRKIGTFHMEDSKSFARWLRGIITRVILRKAGSLDLARRSPLPEEYQPPDLDLTPVTRLTIDELRNVRYRILREFPRLDRLIYRLRARGWSSADIAVRVGLSDRAVRMRFAKTDARIRLRMRQLLGLPARG